MRCSLISLMCNQNNVLRIFKITQIKLYITLVIALLGEVVGGLLHTAVIHIDRPARCISKLSHLLLAPGSEAL